MDNIAYVSSDDYGTLVRGPKFTSDVWQANHRSISHYDITKLRNDNTDKFVRAVNLTVYIRYLFK